MNYPEFDMLDELLKTGRMPASVSEQNPQADIETQMEAPQHSRAPSSDGGIDQALITKAIYSLGPALLGSMTGSAGAKAALPAGLQARELEKADLAAAAEDRRKRDASAKDAQSKAERERAYGLAVAREARSEEREKRAEDRDRRSQERGETEGQRAANRSAMDLRKEFNSRGEVKNLPTVKTAYQNILKTAKNPSAAGDISLLTAYMKMLDPASTVREGEFATAANAGSAFDKVGAQYNQLLEGKRLTDAQRADFLNQSKGFYESALQTAKPVFNEYKEIAKKTGADPSLIVSESSFNVPSDVDEMVAVISPEGKSGKVPKSKLDAALKKGFRVR